MTRTRLLAIPPLPQAHSAMTDQFSKIIEENPIGSGLGAFRASFGAICEGASISRTPDAVERFSHEGKKDNQLRPRHEPLTMVQTSRTSPLSFFQIYESFLHLACSVPAAVARASSAISRDSIPPSAPTTSTSTASYLSSNQQLPTITMSSSGKKSTKRLPNLPRLPSP